MGEFVIGHIARQTLKEKSPAHQMGIFHPLLLKFADHSRDEINRQLRVSVSHGQLKLRVGFVFFLKILLGIGLDDELCE